MNSYKEIQGIEKYPDVCASLDDIEFVLEQRPNLAVQSMRVAVETMLKNLCKQHLGEEGTDNHERIKTLEEKGVIGRSTGSTLHQLRILGNDALHDNYRIEVVDARNYYAQVLSFAQFYAAEADPTGALNRGIRVDMHTSIVTPYEEIIALGSMTREERTRIAESTAQQLKKWIEGWKNRYDYVPEHVKEGMFDPDYPWNGWDAFDIPVCVQDYFIQCEDGVPVQRISRIKITHNWFDYLPVMFCDYVKGVLKYTDRVVIPPLVKGAYLTDELDHDMESEVVFDVVCPPERLRSPSFLLNNVFIGGDFRGNRAMYLSDNELDLVLPDDFIGLKLPEHLRILMVYFPRLRTVTQNDVTWSMKELITEDIRKYMNAGLMKRFGLEIDLPAGKLKGPDTRKDFLTKYTVLPKTVIENEHDSIYYLFTLKRFYTQEIKDPTELCSYTDPRVREYIGTIQGEPVQWVRDDWYPSGLEKGISYESCWYNNKGEFVGPTKHLTDLARTVDHFAILPDWVFEGALALHTDIEQFLNAVLKVRPELLDVEREPEPLPEMLDADNGSAPLPEEKPQRVLNFCPWCGKRVGPEAFFCTCCGERLPR